MTATRGREAHVMFHRMRGVAIVLGVAIAMRGCSSKKAAETSAQAPPPPEPAPVAFRVAGLELGNRIDSGKKVLAPMTTFGKKDTIYVSVATEGATPSATLSARWTFGDAGQLVNEMSETIAPTGPAATEFHISKPSGWPKGKYKVEVSVNGSPAASKEFEVNS
jgi:hypothetical protein